jgi:epoxide hydrolase-like predicted phosphatase
MPSGAPAVAASLASSLMARQSIFRAVFFDFGGVLTTSVWDSFAAFCRSEGLQPDTVKNLFRHDPDALADLRGLETGALTESEFEEKFGRRLGLKDPEHLIDSMFAGMEPEERMVAAVKELRAAGLLIGLITNSWSTNHYDRKLLAELFDTAVISAEVHMHKPQPEIYRLAAERLEVAPEESIFVDDLRENCDGAEAVGMTAVLHRNPPETIARLTELTGIELAAAA